VDIIFDADAAKIALGSAPDDYDIIAGMTVADDGNVYWTMGMNRSGFWKDRFFYRFNVFTNTVEASPLNCGPVGSICSYREGSTNERMFNLEAVGFDNTLTANGQPRPETWFAVFTTNNGNGTWTLDAKTWNLPRRGGIINNTSSDGVWWRDHLTVSAYDPVRKKLWLAGRSRNPSSGNNNQGRPWESRGGARNKNNPILDGDATVLMSVKDEAITSSNNMRRWERRLPVDYTEVTLGTRFRVSEYSTDPQYLGYLIHASVRNTTSPWVGVGIRDGNYKLYDLNTNPATELVDLGPVDTNAYNEIHIYVNAEGTVKVWWNGAEQVVPPVVTANRTSANDHVAFGAVTGASPVDSGGSFYTVRALFDWVGISNTEVPGVVPPAPADLWPSDPLPPLGNGILGAYLDGSFLPEYFNLSNVMTRWTGNSNYSSLFQGDPVQFDSLSSYTSWVVNGNNPGLLDGGTQIGGDGIAGCPATNIPNGGHYWVSALAINPCDGSAWMSWSGATEYETSGEGLLVDRYTYNGTYGPTGKIYTVGADGTIYTAGGDEGAPLAPWTSNVVGITFSGRKVYALVMDLSTNPGTFKVYVADNPAPNCCAAVPFDADDDGDVDLDDFGEFQACYGNETPFAYNLPSCACFDRSPSRLSPDGKIDDADFTKFVNCATRAGVPQLNENCD